ncbi:MAG: hypothetical protein JSW40_08440, partial [Candidatus Omnitrophota bacterium]
MVKNKTDILVMLPFCFFILHCNIALSDMIYLRNGQKLEGIIEEEASDNLSLNIGSGKVILKKREIDYIDRYTFQQQLDLKKKWQYQHFLQPEFVPQS